MPALRSANLEVLHTHNDNRVIAFKRWGTHAEALILASLNNSPFASGYSIAHGHLPGTQGREIFNSDAADYGGATAATAARPSPASGASSLP